MKAVLMKKGWISNYFEVQDIPVPDIKQGEVLVSVCGVGVDKVDTLKSQRCVCPGFECSGTIVAVGRDIKDWKVGDKVCAVIEGGGYAEKVAVPANFLLPVPEHMPLEDAASLPRALCTIWLALFKTQEQLIINKAIILIHKGSSKIALLAIKVAKYMGMRVIVTTGSDQDIPVCFEYGADECINYKTVDFVAFVKARTGMGGVDFVLDFKGSNLKENLDCCDLRGRVLLLKLDGLRNESISLANFVVNHHQIRAINFQSQSLDDKALIVDGVRRLLWPAVDNFKFSRIHKFPMIEVARAHKVLKDIENECIILCNDSNMVDESSELTSSCRPKLE